MADRRAPSANRARTGPASKAARPQAGPRPGTPAAATTSMWQVQRPDGTIATGWYLLPLRLFLGCTFLFAGLQKLANPNFFHDNSPISIHAQLIAATRSSPIHALVSPLVHVATPVGIVIALGELAVAAGTLLGLLTRWAALGGLLLNFMLFLTVSFHASPYFTGSDIVFVFAWTPLILAGAAGAPAVDTWMAWSRPEGRVFTRDGKRAGEIPRRVVVSTGAVVGGVAAGVVVLGGIAAALGRAIGGASDAPAGSHTLSAASTPSGGPGTTTSTTSPSTSSPGGSTPPTTAKAATPKGTAIGPASDVPVGGAANFTDPKSGDPALVIQRSSGQFVAFDAVCPHAGCTVAYQSGSNIIACPCHGSAFNPANGDVIQGPAATGLLHIRIAEGPNGQLYVDS